MEWVDLRSRKVTGRVPPRSRSGSTGSYFRERPSSRPRVALRSRGRIRSRSGEERPHGLSAGAAGGIRAAPYRRLPWIARPVYFDSVFDSWIFPLLGLIFLPFTTLMWLLVGAPPRGVAGWDWLWIVLAVFLDLSHYANTYEQRDKVSAGMGRNPPR